MNIRATIAVVQPVWRLRSTTPPTLWILVHDGWRWDTPNRDEATEWATPEAALRCVRDLDGWSPVPGRPTPGGPRPPNPPPVPPATRTPAGPQCQLCIDTDLVEFRSSIGHRPPDEARCEFCGTPHRLEGGVWVALDRWTGEPI